MASRRPSPPGISLAITGRRAGPASRVWVARSASRKGRERKKSSLEAPAPPSAASSALTVGKAREVLGQKAPDLVVDCLVSPQDRLAHETLLPEAQEGDHLLRSLV